MLLRKTLKINLFLTQQYQRYLAFPIRLTTPTKSISFPWKPEQQRRIVMATMFALLGRKKDQHFREAFQLKVIRQVHRKGFPGSGEAQKAGESAVKGTGGGFSYQ